MYSKKPEPDCPICLGPHDEQIHFATVRVHAWWRESLLNRLSGDTNGIDPTRLADYNTGWHDDASL